MKNAKNGLIKHLHYLCLVSVIALGMITIVGCNGGEDGASTSETDNDVSFDTISFSNLSMRPLATGDPASFSNSYIQVDVSSDKYVSFADVQKILYVWVTVKNLGDSTDKFSFQLTSEVPVEWGSLDASAGSIWLESGQEAEVKLTHSAVYTASSQNETTFTYQASSMNHASDTLSFSFAVTGYPKIRHIDEYSNTDNAGIVRGTVTDATSGNPFSDAQVTLWLVNTISLHPYEMVKITNDNGLYSISSFDVDVLNEYFDPYFTIDGYKLIVQKVGYETYEHSETLKLTNGTPIDLDIALTPLSTTTNFEQKWATSLSSPGVWEIAVSDNWDRFAVAMGKHPDDDDPDLLPTQIPFLDNNGNILWSKELLDESWSIDIASDGSYVACTAEQGESKYYLWDSSGDEVWSVTNASHSLEINLSHDNQYVATGPVGSSIFGVLSTTTGTAAWDYDTENQLRATEFTEDGNYVVAAPPLHFFTIAGDLVWRKYLPGIPYEIHISSDGSKIMIPTKSDVVNVFDSNGNILWQKEIVKITYGAMSSDGSSIVIISSDGYLYSYDGDGTLKWCLMIDTGTSGAGAGHNGLAMTPDGNYIAVGGGNFYTLLYDSNGNLLWRHNSEDSINYEVHPYKNSVMSVRISDDGTKIVSGYGYSDPRLCYFEKVE